MNVDLTPAEIRWLAGLIQERRSDMRGALRQQIAGAAVSLDAAEMRRCVSVAEKLEHALRPGKAGHG